jgi:Tn3 transposase DDE domain
MSSNALSSLDEQRGCRLDSNPCRATHSDWRAVKEGIFTHASNSVATPATRLAGRAGLVPISRRDLDLDLVHAELDELLRVAASINDGYGSATYLFERLGVTERKAPAERRTVELSAPIDDVRTDGIRNIANAAGPGEN